MEQTAEKREAGPDAEIAEYIKHLRFRKKLFGADPEELWTVISNIRRVYEWKRREDEICIKMLRKEICDLAKQNTILRLKLEADRRGNDTDS